MHLRSSKTLKPTEDFRIRVGFYPGFYGDVSETAPVTTTQKTRRLFAVLDLQDQARQMRQVLQGRCGGWAEAPRTSSGTTWHCTTFAVLKLVLRAVDLPWLSLQGLKELGSFSEPGPTASSMLGHPLNPQPLNPEIARHRGSFTSDMGVNSCLRTQRTQRDVLSVTQHYHKTSNLSSYAGRTSNLHSELKAPGPGISSNING